MSSNGEIDRNRTIEILKQKLDYLQESYNNTSEEIVSDQEFDAMVKYYESYSGLEYKAIGAKSREEAKPLPAKAPSLDKIKDKNAERDLAEFLNRYPECNTLIDMDKYDGVSLIVEYNNGTIICQKRGDGNEGPYVSFIQKYISFPQLPFNILIRGEVMLFEEKLAKLKPYLESTGKKANNSRSIVNGAMNNLTPDATILTECLFIPYSILEINAIPEYNIPGGPLTQSQQLEYLKYFGFIIPPYITLSKQQITLQSLFDYLEKRKTEIPYRIDGTVLIFDIPMGKPIENKNPHHAIAVKRDTVKFTYVRDCGWNLTSKDGYMTPVIQVDPVTIVTTVTNITLNNARMIYLNNIGSGAYIAVTQGGDIIPKFLFTVEPAKYTFSPSVPYHWNPNGVEVMVDNPDNYPQIKCAKIKYFLDALGVKRWGLLTIFKLYMGGLTNIGKIVRVTVQQLMEAGVQEDGGTSVQEKGAIGLYEELQKGIKRATIPKIMAGSCIFGEGIGEGTMDKFINNFPNWRNTKISYEDIISKRDFGPVKARIISDNLSKFNSWLNQIPELEGNFINVQEVKSSILAPYFFRFTGFTDDVMTQEIRTFGGRVKDSGWENSVNVVVRKDNNYTSDKTEKALSSGGKITLITRAELEEKMRSIRLGLIK